MFFGEPERTGGDLCFSLFRVPVRVHPFFWIVGLLLGIREPDPMLLITWMVAFFLSILVHELGHAAAMRAYGYYPSITLYGMGGLTSFGPARPYGSRSPGFAGRILISAAGPGAGFAVAAILLGAFRLAGYPVVWPQYHRLYGFVFGVVDIGGPPVLLHLVNQFLLISIFWGLLNLLPIFPLDGGQIAREIAVKVYPSDGLRLSLMLSLVVAALIAVIALVQWREVWTAAIFGYLAFNSYAMLSAYSGGGPWR